VSSPELEPEQLATILAQKATDDAVAVREIEGNLEIADSILGFHAQQAIEKWLKAILAANRVDFEYTHDLRHLIGLVEFAGLSFPFDIPQVVMFTEFAVPLRYEDLLDAEPLDRPGAVTLVNEVGAWAQSMLDTGDR